MSSIRVSIKKKERNKRSQSGKQTDTKETEKSEKSEKIQQIEKSKEKTRRGKIWIRCRMQVSHIRTGYFCADILQCNTKTPIPNGYLFDSTSNQWKLHLLIHNFCSFCHIKSISLHTPFTFKSLMHIWPELEDIKLNIGFECTGHVLFKVSF